MRKKYSWIFLSALLGVFLGGCSQQSALPPIEVADEINESTTKPQASSEYVLRFPKKFTCFT